MLQAPLDPPENDNYSKHESYKGGPLQLGTSVLDDMDNYFDIDDKWEAEEYCEHLIEDDFPLVKEIIMEYLEDYYGTKRLEE